MYGLCHRYIVYYIYTGINKQACRGMIDRNSLFDFCKLLKYFAFLRAKIFLSFPEKSDLEAQCTVNLTKADCGGYYLPLRLLPDLDAKLVHLHGIHLCIWNLNSQIHRYIIYEFTVLYIIYVVADIEWCLVMGWGRGTVGCQPKPRQA